MPRTACPCCPWNCESHRFPRHAITSHLKAVHFCRVQFDHCAYLYLKNGKKELEFVVCLSCRKGTTSDPSTGNGSRWVSRHAVSAACKSAHPSAFLAFKKQCEEEAIAAAGAALTVSTCASEPHTKPTVSPTAALDVWEKCKQNKRVVGAFLEVEERLKEAAIVEEPDEGEDPAETSVERGEYVFDPMEGFICVAAAAIDFKKEYTMTKKEMQAAILRHDSELVKHTKEIVDQKMVIHNQNRVLCEKTQEIRELNEVVRSHEQQMKALQEELEALKAKCRVAGIE